MSTVHKLSPKMSPKKVNAFKVAERVGFEPADRNKRVIAFLIDGLIASSTTKFVGATVLKPMGLSALSAELVGLLICVSLYWVGLTLQFGATPGKKIMGIRIVTVNDDVELGVGQLFLRETVGRMISLLPVGLGYMWVSFRKHRRAWHDILAKTRVVDYR